MAAQKKDEKPARLGDSEFEAPTATSRRITNPEITGPHQRPSAPRPSAPSPSPSAPKKPALTSLGVKRVNLDAVKGHGATKAPQHPVHHHDAFGSDAAQRKRAELLGASSGSMPIITGSHPIPDFIPDGKNAPAELQRRESWRAVQPPIVNDDESRDRAAYQKVLLQFALTHNPRYRPDGETPRGHIFVWDVSRAMGCEIPHFVSGQELSLGQTVDWIRRDAVARGWRPVSFGEDAINAAESGQLVLALPKDHRLRQVAIVPPQRPAPIPLVTGAGLIIGNGRAAKDLLGANQLEFFTHP